MHNELYLTYTQLSKEQLNKEFTSACASGNVKAINYLLNTKELGLNADIDYNNDAGIVFACMNGNLEAVKYLLTDPNLKKKAYIHANDDRAFKSSCLMEHYHVLNYLILDFQLAETEEIKEYMHKNPNPIITSMFLNRRLEILLAEPKGLAKEKNRTLKI